MNQDPEKSGPPVKQEPCQAPGRKPHISIAPMMDWTDRHCRYFHRLISPNVRLFTEMVTTGAIIHGDRDRFLRFDKTQHPIALQLGGSDAQDLAFCAKAAEEYKYDQINLNCGCPSDRVQSGRFGACLMKEPDTVADCVEAMMKATDIPVTVKCRIGIDDFDSFEFLDAFVNTIAGRGCKTFILHARKAWLKGLSPKENREIPVLDYDRVRAIKQKYPDLEIILNGGIKDIQTIRTVILSEGRKPEAEGSKDPRDLSTSALRASAQDDIKLDGAMIGREAYHNPWFLHEIEKEIFGNNAPLSRDTVVLKMVEYAREQRKLYDTPIKSITRHMIGLYHELPGAKQWRRALSTLPYEDGVDENILLRALEAIESRQKIAA